MVTSLGRPEIPLISWAGDSGWSAVNQAIDRLHHRHVKALQPVHARAHQMAGLLAPLFDAMDILCRRSCQFCPQPCCLHATMGYGLRDLLFLHLTGQPLPPAQTMAGRQDTCRYVGPKGCRLPRMTRPFICTWYVCPVQRSVLQREDTSVMQNVFPLIRRIKSIRNQMEADFIQITS